MDMLLYAILNKKIKNSGGAGGTAVYVQNCTINDDGNLIVTLSDGSIINAGQAKGNDGIDGFSPIANVVYADRKVTITITDKSGTTSAEITDIVTDDELESAKKQIYSDMAAKDNRLETKIDTNYNILSTALNRTTIYLNQETGNDDNDGLTVSAPMKTITSALDRYSFYSNIRLQLAAGTYDIGTMTAENKKIAIVGAGVSATTICGKINVTSCCLTLSALTITADSGTDPIVSVATGSHLYAYRANFTSVGGAECLRISTASQCYLDGSVFVTDAETDIVIRSSGGAVIGLGYCTIPGLVCASTTGVINTTGGTIGGTKIDSGGIISINGSKI